MITQMYVFSPGSYITAEEWNANFDVLYKVSYQHSEAIDDAYNELAFPNSDLTNVFNAAKAWQNSEAFTGNTITVNTEREYYTTLAAGQDLTIEIERGMNGEARVLVELTNNRTQKFFTISYNGNTLIEYDDYYYNGLTIPSGYYYIMIYESNNVAQVKLIWTGV